MIYIRQKAKILLLISSFAVFLLFGMLDRSFAATYTASPQITTEGDSYWGDPLFVMMVSITGSTGQYTISKKDYSSFTSPGTMYLKEDSPEESGENVKQQSITTDQLSGSFFENLDNLSSSSYPRTVYARFEPDAGGWAWVGPITITRTETPPSLGSTGSITSPGSSAQGDFTVSCDASDPAGLEKVSVVFPSGDTLVLCEDGTSTTCFGNSDFWSKNITPADYGITSEGTYTLSLWVANENGDSPTRVDTQTVNWSPEIQPPSDPTGSITSPGSSAEGNFTVSCNANDPAGIEKVSIVFVPDKDPLVMCENGTSNPCNTTSDSWTKSDINPLVPPQH